MFSPNKAHKHTNEKKKPRRTSELRLQLPPAIIQIDLVARVLSSSYINLTHENTYHF